MSFLDAMCLAVFVATHVRRPFWNRGNVHVLIYLRRDQQSKDASAVFRFSSRPLSRGSLLDLHLVQLFRVVTFDMFIESIRCPLRGLEPQCNHAYNRVCKQIYLTGLSISLLFFDLMDFKIKFSHVYIHIAFTLIAMSMRISIAIWPCVKKVSVGRRSLPLDVFFFYWSSSLEQIH